MATRELVSELDVAVHEVTHGLHARPSGRGAAERLPGDGREVVGVAVTTAEQVDERLFRQRLNAVLLGVRHKSNREHPNPRSRHRS